MKETRGRKREPITDAREHQIITMIQEWDPQKIPLTREGLAKRIKCEMGVTFTRQGLMKRKDIRLAFERREKEINGSAPARAEEEPLIVVLDRTVDELKGTVDEQAKVIARYQEIFLTYRYNARQHGITREQLEAPIPPRNQTEGGRG